MRQQRTLYLHIGLPKTATTYAQAQLWNDRMALARQHLLYPGTSPADHFRAAVEMTGGRYSGLAHTPTAGSLDALLAEIDEWPGSAIISHELFAGMRTTGVARLLDKLGGRHVVPIITVRDLSEIIPAMFQERARNRRVETWGHFVGAVRSGPPHAFWRLQNLPAILRTWQKFAPGDRMHVITVARATGQETLLERFGEALGVQVTARPTTSEAAVNASLDTTQLRVLQEINKLSVGRLDRPTYDRVVKFGVVPRRLAPAANGPRLILSEDERPWVEEYTEQALATIRDSGCTVIGDLAELGPHRFAVDPVDPDHVSAAVIAEAAAAVILDLAVDTEEPVSLFGAGKSQVQLMRGRYDGVRSIYRRHDGKAPIERVRSTLTELRDLNPFRRGTDGRVSGPE